MSGVLRISYDNANEMREKLCTAVRRLGYHVTPALPERITVGELARRVGRELSTVSMSLRRKSCPPFESLRGKKQILWLEPTEKLMTYLRENRKGIR